ncbi:hypothetical protein HYX03_02260 [Candidatus Woesearchaeota archaeon]|nr:hypothetical protein [Candidatus Woesearchaeota archaeon]
MSLDAISGTKKQNPGYQLKPNGSECLEPILQRALADALKFREYQVVLHRLQDFPVVNPYEVIAMMHLPTYLQKLQVDLKLQQ